MAKATYTAEQIVGIGGNEWKRGDHHRVYLDRDVWTKLAGLELSGYSTGNISYAELDGTHISNNRAHRLATSVRTVYLDAANGKIVIVGRFGPQFDEMSARIREGIAQAVSDNA